MPIFGSPFTLDDNERRRRLLEGALSPGLPQGGRGRAVPMGVTPINPDAPAPLPNIPMPRPAPRPLPGIPGGVPSGPMPGSPRPSELPEIFASGGAPFPAPPMPDAPIAPLRRPSRYEELGEAKDVYLQGAPGRFKSAVLGALRGFGQGLQTGGGLGAGLGGAVAGAGFGGINPRGQREMEFNERIRPQIRERFAFEDADRAAQQAAEKALREDQMARANIANIQSQIGSRGAADALNLEKFDYERGKPTVLNPGQIALDPRTQQPVFTAPDRPSPADDTAKLKAALTDERGTLEAEAKRTLEGRREMLKKHLTPDERRIIDGKITKDDGPDVIARAQTKWQKIQDDEFQSILRNDREQRETEITKRRFGRKGQRGRTAISVSEAADLLR